MSRFLLTLLLLCAPVALSAQALAPSSQVGQKPRVFLDCPTTNCDSDFFVTEIPYVDFIRDRAGADVHVLLTSLETGSGGSSYTVNFIGLGRRAGQADTIVTSVPPNSSEDLRRKEMARVVKLGLVRYVVATEAGAHLKVNYDAPAAAKDATAKVTNDPWNYWVYRVGGNSNFGGESESHRASFSGNVSARRTTEELKLSLAASGSYRESRYNFSDGTESFFALRNYDGSFRMVKSYGQHWSAGVNAGIGSSDFSNQKLSANALASAEYNFFPGQRQRATNWLRFTPWAPAISSTRKRRSTSRRVRRARNTRWWWPRRRGSHGAQWTCRRTFRSTYTTLPRTTPESLAVWTCDLPRGSRFLCSRRHPRCATSSTSRPAT